MTLTRESKNSPLSLKRKQEILLELEQLATAKRKLRTKTSLTSFVDTYLKHLTPVASPPFHKDMQEVMERAISQPITYKENEQGGSMTPTPPPKNIYN